MSQQYRKALIWQGEKNGKDIIVFQFLIWGLLGLKSVGSLTLKLLRISPNQSIRKSIYFDYCNVSWSYMVRYQ